VINSNFLSGHLGQVSFGNNGSSHAKLTLTFEGDTENVISWLLPIPTSSGSSNVTSGFENRIGTASFQLVDAYTGAVMAEGMFQPAAGIFVSVDNTNFGVGFGSFGVPPSDTANFPGQPIYPYALVSLGNNVTPNLGGYDLRSDYDSGLQLALSCINFPTANCGTPLALPTTAGDLYLDPCGVRCLPFGAHFTAHVNSATSFSNFLTQIEIFNGSAFRLKGTFTLGPGNNGIDPLNENVTLQLGTSTFILPSGSFKRADEQRAFEGVVNGTGFTITIEPLSGSRYTISVNGYNLDLTTMAQPLAVGLTIGDDIGMSSAQMEQ
jgi:hypothetical protein